MTMSKYASLAVVALLAACGGGGAGGGPGATDRSAAAPANTAGTPGTATPTNADGTPRTSTSTNTGGTPGTSTPTNTGGTPGTSTPTNGAGTPTQSPAIAPTSNALTARLNSALSARTAVARLPQTTVANTPTSGRSTFNGPALITVVQGTKNYSIVGDSRLTMDFDNRQMGGGITNLEGRTGDGSPFAATGTIDYSTGKFPNSGTSPVFGTAYKGNLNVADNTIALEGRAVGSFLGNRDSGTVRPRAIQALDGTAGSDVAKSAGFSNMTATINGRTATGQLLIVGQN